MGVEVNKTLSDYTATLARPDVRAAEFDILYEGSMTPTAFVDVDGVFMSVNTAFAEMLGYSRLELVAVKKWQDVTHRDDIAVYEREADALARNQQPNGCYRIQKRYLHKDGRYIYCVVQVSRVPLMGDFIHFVKQATEIPISGRHLIVERDEQGNPMIVPTVRVEDFVKRNWKVISAVVVPVVTWIGITANDYYATRARAEFQTQQIENQKKEIEVNRGEMEKMRQRLDAHLPK